MVSATDRECAHAVLVVLDQSQLPDSSRVKHCIDATCSRIQHEHAFHWFVSLLDSQQHLHMGQISNHDQGLPTVVQLGGWGEGGRVMEGKVEGGIGTVMAAGW